MALDFILQTIEKNNMKKIFVMVPSLFDRDIQKTVEDCLLKATYPERITFGISLQGVTEVNFDNIKNEKRIIVLDKNIVYGIGKTRYHLQQLYNNEDYILSIDCHTRFCLGWDEKLIFEYEKINNDKAIISQFLSDMFMSYCRKSKYIYSENGCWAMEYVFSHDTDFIKDKHLSQRVAPHFIFASKRFMEIDYPYMYFWGDEDHILSMKLFCNGFDTYELSQTYLTTTPKDAKGIMDRTNWFLSAVLKYDSTQKYTIDPVPVNQSNSLVEYDNHDTELSDHLLYPGTKKMINKPVEVGMLLENEYSHILKEDFRNTERSIKQYFDFHGISQEDVQSVIDKSRQWVV